MSAVRPSSAASPRRVRLAFGAVFFAVWMVVDSVLTGHGSWLRTVTGALVASAIYTVVMAWTTRRQDREVEAAVTGLSHEQRREALRAARSARSAHVPADPVVRRAAAGVVQVRLSAYRRHRGVVRATFLFLAAVGLLGAAADSLWYLLVTALFLAGLVWAESDPGRLERRAAALDAQSPGVSTEQ